jgi:hypothetical protein
MADTDAPVGPTTHSERIRAAADRVEEAREALELAKERRDAAIIDGRDTAGLGYNLLARYARLSKSRVIAILGGG